MAELSHRALRELIEGFGGCDWYFTEMISAGALVSGGRFESWYIDAGPCPGRVVYQLVGAEPDHLAAAAAFLNRYECAGIDINMGCSAPAITRTGAGVRWMASVDRAGDLVDRVRKSTRRRLSVKLRIGLEDDFEYLLRFCRRLVEAGTELITLHPRTSREKFRRRARWEYVGRLREALDIPVAGNGDVDSVAELLRRGAGGIPGEGAWDAVMAGRLAVREPWVFARARAGQAGETGPGEAELREAGPGSYTGRLSRLPAPKPPEFPAGATGVDLEETGLRFLDLLARYQPPEFHLSRARRFFSYFCDNLTWAHYLKTLLGRETGLPGIAARWSAYFREYPGERLLKP
ncbi:MAG: tRNA-dihydrouridine synthase family protein [Spirochaetaceae bacterium]|jgi:tRNA-dihydrouridine synthase|nr:tRNA-dihydrouridine synthase family protein [Spirochaetaceae bacterium]